MCLCMCVCVCVSVWYVYVVETKDLVDTKSPKAACPIAKCRNVRMYITSPLPMKHQKGRRVFSVN